MYVSCFGGGVVGLKNVILERRRQELGLRPSMFKQSSCYGKDVAQAESVAKLVVNSNVIKSFKHVAKHSKTLYLNKTIIGPTGYSLAIDEENVRSQYSNYLQDFERAVKAEFCLRLVDKFKGAEVVN